MSPESLGTTKQSISILSEIKRTVENSISFCAIKTKPIEKAMAINTIAMGSLIELRLMNVLK
ncbi:MAG: hypothetical protein QGH37_01900, partial [Candidatus Poribacteria bacterium]|nr:hypothetical protein [Candidatus Poribacteria bacterium]